jgi:hypothetical protein
MQRSHVKKTDQTIVSSKSQGPVTDCAKNPRACVAKGIEAGSEKVTSVVRGAVDCVKNPRACAKKGTDKVRDMHKDLGGGVQGAVGLAATALAAVPPGGVIAAPLVYKAAKAFSGHAEQTISFKEWFYMMEIGGQGPTAAADPAPQPSTVAMATGGGAFPIYSDSDKPPVNKSVERSITLKYLPKKKKSKKKYSHHK